MNNMQFDEATQTYHGTVDLYRWSGEEEGQIFTGFNKPLQVTPEWIAQSYKDVFASYWQDQPPNEGNWESFAARPWRFMEQHQNQNPLTQTTDGVLEQLIQAMAGFAPAGAGQVQESATGLFAAMQMWGIDGGA